MKKNILWVLFIILGFASGIIFSRYINSFYYSLFPKTENSTMLKILPKPLEKYSILNLSETVVKPSNINIEEEISENEDFTSNLFSISFDPTLKDVIEKALNKINKPGITTVSTTGSEEMSDTNKQSLVKPFKGYKRK